MIGLISWLLEVVMFGCLITYTVDREREDVFIVFGDMLKIVHGCINIYVGTCHALYFANNC